MEWRIGETVWVPITCHEWCAGTVVGHHVQGRVRVNCHRGNPMIVTRYVVIGSGSLEKRDLLEQGADIPRVPPFGLAVFGPTEAKANWRFRNENSR